MNFSKTIKTLIFGLIIFSTVNGYAVNRLLLYSTWSRNYTKNYNKKEVRIEESLKFDNSDNLEITKTCFFEESGLGQNKTVSKTIKAQAGESTITVAFHSADSEVNDIGYSCSKALSIAGEVKFDLLNNQNLLKIGELEFQRSSLENWEEAQLVMDAKRTLIPENFMEFWQKNGQMQKPVKDRLLELTPGLANLLKNYMDLFFFDDHELSTIGVMDEKLKKDVMLAINSIPTVLEKAASPYMVGIVPIRNLNANNNPETSLNGFALPLVDKKGVEQGVVFFMNLDKFNKLNKSGEIIESSAFATINERWSDKAMSPFMENDGHLATKIYAKVDPNPIHNTRSMAFLTTMIHEIAHSLHAGLRHTPVWNIPEERIWQPGDHVYTDFSWKNDGNNKAIFNNATKEVLGEFEGKLKYFKPEEKRKLKNNDIWDFYKKLYTSNFINDYSTFRVNEDYAEFFKFYILIKVMGLSPQYEIHDPKNNRKTTYKISEIIESDQYAEKRKYVEKILGLK